MEKYEPNHPSRTLQRRLHAAVCKTGLPALETIEVLSDFLNANVRGFNDYLANQTTSDDK